jgi:hypothetical protein
MQIIKSLLNVAFFIFPICAIAQTTYLPQGDKGYQFVDRLEIKQQYNTHLNFTSLKPYSRKAIVLQAEFLDSARRFGNDAQFAERFKQWKGLQLTKIDAYNLQSFLMNNTEFVSGDRDNFKSKKNLFNRFYLTKPNLLEVKTKDFFLVVNPMLHISLGNESGNNERLFNNSRGVALRGMIAKKIGFAASIVDNQERGPKFFQAYVARNRAVPGVGFYKGFKNNGQDYFDARGYITFNAAKYIDVQFGFDKNFIGNGYRSLFLSDWGNSNLFLKLNTKIWRFNYQNIFMELNPQFNKFGDSLLKRKYAAMHHLSINLTKWLNVGLFEGVVFGRVDHFDFQYLNPIIFYRHIEGTIGSPDNALAGFDFKANVAKKMQFYGQILLDEFKLDQIRANTGWWANKWALQLGVKYIDAFGIPNLDIQLESNRVRPFTYSHNNIISNYTHYNQPLAHPLGANFQEFIGIVRYQPAPKWYVNARVIAFKQGLDSANGRNYGANPFNLPSINRTEDYGYTLGSGRKTTGLNAILQLSYEFRENLYFDINAQYRNYQIANEATTPTATIISAGIRLNFNRREYDF